MQPSLASPPRIRKRLTNKALPVASSLNDLPSIKALESYLALTDPYDATGSCDGEVACEEAHVPAPSFACEEPLYRKASNRRLKLQEGTIQANKEFLRRLPARFALANSAVTNSKAPIVPKYVCCAPSLPKEKIKCEYCKKHFVGADGLAMHQAQNTKCKRKQDLLVRQQADHALDEEERWFLARDWLRQQHP